jgi:hypothetical protein
MPVGMTPLQATYTRSASGLPGVTVNVTGADANENLTFYVNRDGAEYALIGNTADGSGNCDQLIAFPTSFFDADVAVCFWHVTGDGGFDANSPTFALTAAASTGAPRGRMGVSGLSLGL